MDLDLTLRFLLALLFVLALIGVFAWAARRFGLAGRLGPVAGKGRRLKVLEVAAVDPKTRLVLVRRDAVEHLVLVGPNGGVVVESGIVPGNVPGGDFAAALATAPTARDPESRT